jgi:hypothetical protein
MSYPSKNPQNKERAQHIRTVGPFDAISAHGSKLRAQDAEWKSRLPGSINGPADALRHCTWSCDMTRNIGADQAREVGDVHEIWNVGEPDANNMDLFNNALGRGLAENAGSCPVLCGNAVESGAAEVMPEGTWK